jgi:putative ATP-dependent endonuclease of OLD family
MHISRLSLVNYRNFRSAKLLFKKGVNTIIGENGSGKSNVLRALRLLLDDNMPRAAIRLEEKDFCRALPSWKGHWIIISIEFEEISNDEVVQALFAHATGDVEEGTIEKGTYNLIVRPRKEIRLKLAELEDGDEEGMQEILDPITIDDYETLLTGRSTADFNDEGTYNRIVGDFENVVFNEETEFPEIGAPISSLMGITKQVSFTFVQALRDVVNEFRNNRTNPLFGLLKGKSGDIDPDAFAEITEQVVALNQSIEEFSDVQEIRTDIASTVRDTAGDAFSPRSLSIKSDLPEEAEKLFQSLKLFVGESGEGYEGPVEELSLGGANLIYLTLKLLEFKYRRQRHSVANFLLIEEPEAHIHNHIQKTLFDRITFSETQIIYTTHSTQISEVSNIERVNILGKADTGCESYQPATGLEDIEIRNVQRYLDAVRSNLLFAKSVILVEGDAEEILIPILVKQVLGISLDELGISLINIRSTGFKNVAVLFDDERIRKRCAIVTDLDTAVIDITDDPADTTAVALKKKAARASEKSGEERREILDEFAEDNEWVEVFYAENTFEVQFVESSNAYEARQIIESVYSQAEKIAQATRDLSSADKSRYGTMIVRMAKKVGKGWFAILLGEQIAYNTFIPDYILDAIAFVKPEISVGVWYNILKYRLGECQDNATGDEEFETMEALSERLEEFRGGDLTFEEIKEIMIDDFDDQTTKDFLERY